RRAPCALTVLRASEQSAGRALRPNERDASYPRPPPGVPSIVTGPVEVHLLALAPQASGRAGIAPTPLLPVLPVTQATGHLFTATADRGEASRPGRERHRRGRHAGHP